MRKRTKRFWTVTAICGGTTLLFVTLALINYFDPEFESLIAALRKTSPEFSRAWERHEVSQSGEGRKDLRHPLAGMMSFSHAVFHPAERLEQRLILYSPLPENETAAKLARLMDDQPSPAPPIISPRTPALVLAAD